MHTNISDITKSYREVANYYTVGVAWLNVDPSPRIRMNLSGRWHPRRFFFFLI